MYGAKVKWILTLGSETCKKIQMLDRLLPNFWI